MTALGLGPGPVPPRLSLWAADEQGCRYYRLALPAQTVRRLFGADITLSTDLFGDADSPSEIAERAAGRTVTLAMVGADRELKAHRGARRKDVDVIVAQRVCLPGPSRVIEKLSQREIGARPRLVFELDDDLFDLDRTNPAHAFFSDPTVQMHLRQNVQRCDAATVSTRALGEKLVRLGLIDPERVYVLPNTIPEHLLTWERPHRRDNTVTVGWAGSHTHAMDWAVLERPLERWLRAHLPRGVELHTIGTSYGARMSGIRYRHTGWADTVPGYHRLLDFHIGLAPLAPHPFNESKSHIKALEYAALGIPIVASDVGPYRRFVRHGLTGFLVGREPESLTWTEALSALLLDPGGRTWMAERAREQAGGFTAERWARTYLHAWLGMPSTATLKDIQNGDTDES